MIAKQLNTRLGMFKPGKRVSTSTSWKELAHSHYELNGASAGREETVKIKILIASQYKELKSTYKQTALIYSNY